MSTPKQEAERLKEEGKSVLTLIIKQKYFDMIVEGTKKQEFRELKPSTLRRLVKTQGDTILTTPDEHFIPVEYDAILFFVGYAKDRDSALVEVVGAREEYINDENGEPIKIVIDEATDTYDYISQIVYDLGKVIAVAKK